MPKQKDLKRVVRARMQKTGESYTSARSQVLKKKTTAAKSTNGTASTRKKSGAKQDLAKLAGMSDDTVKTKTGCDWKRWTDYLDAVGAADMTHKQIAKYIHEHNDVSGWWAQSITVGYERIKGRREKGQKCDGDFSANKSKTFPVPIATLYKAFRLAPQRKHWMPDVKLTVRKATPNKSLRITWDDATTVDVYFTDKGKQKSQVQIQHNKLKDRADIDRRKEFWGEHLTALAAHLK